LVVVARLVLVHANADDPSIDAHLVMALLEGIAFFWAIAAACVAWGFFKPNRFGWWCAVLFSVLVMLISARYLIEGNPQSILGAFLALLTIGICWSGDVRKLFGIAATAGK